MAHDFVDEMDKFYLEQRAAEERKEIRRRSAEADKVKFVRKSKTRANLPNDPKLRKRFPVATGVLDYFPDALVEIAGVSFAGNEQHNPGQPLHWAREKSTDQDDTLIRHFLQRGSRDTDGQRHSAKMAWRALALLQLEIEAEQNQAEDKNDQSSEQQSGAFRQVSVEELSRLNLLTQRVSAGEIISTDDHAFLRRLGQRGLLTESEYAQHLRGLREVEVNRVLAHGGSGGESGSVGPNANYSNHAGSERGVAEGGSEGIAEAGPVRGEKGPQGDPDLSKVQPAPHPKHRGRFTRFD